MTKNDLLMLAIAIQANVPVLTWGDPGIGKTAIMKAIAKGLKVPIEILIASIRDPTDFGGLPYAMDGYTRLLAPYWAKKVSDWPKTDRGISGILFFDEISTAPPATQAALLRPIHEGVVGEMELPPTIVRVAAANPPDSAAGGWDLTPPAANRFIHLNWTPDVDQWCEGMANGFSTPEIPVLPATWEEDIPMRNSFISGFIKGMPDLLHTLRNGLRADADDPKSLEPLPVSQSGRAWASPRTWEMAGRVWAACEAAGVHDDIRDGLFAGCVGAGPALSLITWLKEQNLPDPELLLKNPGLYKPGKRHDVVWAVLSSVSSAVLRTNTADRWYNASEVFSIACDSGIPRDVVSHVYKNLANHKPDGLKKVHPVIAKLAPMLAQSVK